MSLGEPSTHTCATSSSGSERPQAIAKGRSPIERVAAGEILEDLVVEVAHEARPTSTKIVRIRSLIVTTAKGLPDCSALILSDISGHIKAEERFERMFAANPAPAVICRLSDLRFVKVNEGFLQLSRF